MFQYLKFISLNKISSAFTRIIIIYGYVLIGFLVFGLLFINISKSSNGYWGIFHYFLGAKYFNEVGYFDLYPCTLEADKEKSKVWDKAVIVRNVKTYELIYRDKLPECPRERFTANRWQAFTTDVAIITSWAPAEYWNEVIKDKGFNPPPFWIVVFGFIANKLPLENAFIMSFIFKLDLFFVVIAALIVWLSAGFRVALLTLVLLLSYFGTLGRIGNNYIQFAWLPFIVASVAAWRAKHFAVSGITLGIATGLQSFPSMFVIPVIIYAFWDWVFRRYESFWSSFLFLRFFFVTIVVCVLLGAYTSWGLSGWRQWQEKIILHKEYLHGELFNIGLPNFIATIVSRDQAVTYSYLEDYPHTLSRNNSFLDIVWVWYVLILSYLGILVFILRRRVDDPMKFGFIPIYVLLSLSPYYYLILALLPYMYSRSSQRERKYVFHSTLILFSIYFVLFWKAIFLFSDSDAFDYKAQFIKEFLLWSFITGTILVSLFTQPVTQGKLISNKISVRKK